jgi:hypothetical protein
MMLTSMVLLALLDLALCSWGKGRLLSIYRKIRRVIFVVTLLFAGCVIVGLIGYLALHAEALNFTPPGTRPWVISAM